MKFWKDKNESIEKAEKAAILDRRISENLIRREKEISKNIDTPP
jgi:hypothetical protein